MANKSVKPVAVFITDTHCDTENLSLIDSIFNQLFNYCSKYGVQYVIHGGDWFTNRSGQSLKCMLLIQSIIYKFVNAGIVFYSIAGNHDKPDLDAEVSYLNLFGPIKGFKLFDFGTSEILLEHNIILHFLSYYKDPTVYLTKLQGIHKSASSYEDDTKHILITHQSIDGVRNNDGSVVAGDFEVGFFQIFYKVLVGHYHDAQVIDNIVYTGSAYQANFGEAFAGKGFTAIYADGSMQHKRLEFPLFEKVGFKATDISLANKALEFYQQEYFDQEIPVHVRFIFKGTTQELETLDISRFIAAGIDVKRENIAAAVLFDELGDAPSIVMTKGTILKGWNEYVDHLALPKDLKIQGLKLLSTLNLK